MNASVAHAVTTQYVPFVVHEDWWSSGGGAQAAQAICDLGLIPSAFHFLYFVS